MDDYFLRVRRKYPRVAEGEAFEISLQELTEVFHCSGRNANLVLRRMQDAGWIRWSPGRGRGNRSSLTFLVKAESVALEAAQHFVSKGDIQGAFAYLEELHELPSLKDQFVYWLDTQFGFRPEPKEEQTLDTLRLPYSKRINSLDPSLVTYVVESHMVQQIFDTLVRYNQQADTFEGHIAHFWTQNDNDRSWTFYLRKGVYFHHGRELTSGDVRYTLERIKSEDWQSPFRWLFADVEAIETLGPYAIHIRLRRANPLFLHHLSFDRASIVPQDAVQELGDNFKKTPIGTGPFKVARHDENKLVLEAFPRYFERRAHLDRVEIWYTPELTRKASQLEALSYQMRSGAHSESDLPADWKIVKKIGTDCTFLIFNLNFPGPQQQLEFRKAVIHGVDRKLLLSNDQARDTVLAEWFYDKGEVRSDTDQRFDPITARGWLHSSGYKGEMITLAYRSKNSTLAEKLRDQLFELGIRVQLIDRGDNCEITVESSDQAHMTLNCNVLDEDIELSVIELFLADNSVVRSFLGQELKQQTDWLIERMYQEGSSITRSGYVDRLRQLLNDQAYILYLHHHTLATVFHPSLKNVSLNSLGWVQFRDLWFEPTGSTAMVMAK